MTLLLLVYKLSEDTRITMQKKGDSFNIRTVQAALEKSFNETFYLHIQSPVVTQPPQFMQSVHLKPLTILKNRKMINFLLKYLAKIMLPFKISV
jgi:hypothetical protein